MDVTVEKERQMNMSHLDYLDEIARTDVSELLRKEATYRGSWKRRGGVGAFMMLARKWDRLEGMTSGRAWDVFDTPGDGSDGTPLAEIRDLRRYLLLVEAELRAQTPSVFRSTRSNVSVIEESPPKPSPESGSHHESLHPWLTGGHHAANHPRWYEKVGDGQFALLRFVPMSAEDVSMDDRQSLPRFLENLYETTNSPRGWRLKLSLCPTGAQHLYESESEWLVPKEAE